MNKPLPLAEACLRNQKPIADCLESILITEQTVLEIGSGTGQHAVFVCKQLPNLIWQPTELAERVAEVEAWRLSENLSNVKPSLALDVLQSDWQLNQLYDTVFTANTIHFIGWQKVEALLKGASEHLKKGGNFICYGPFNINQQYTSEGNRNLDAWLKQRDAESGIKDVSDVLAMAKQYNLDFIEQIQMPANNLILHFIKQ